MSEPAEKLPALTTAAEASEPLISVVRDFRTTAHRGRQGVFDEWLVLRAAPASAEGEVSDE